MNLIKMDGFFHPSQAKGAVHIIGCGAVGSSIAFILAHCGVTNFSLYDDDTVESHNIANQMFRETDIGKFKVDAMAEQLHAINPDIGRGLKLVREGWTGQKLSGYVFLCVDNIDLRREIAQACQGSSYVKGMFDFRMRLTDAQHYAADWSDKKSVENFLKTMAFSPSLKTKSVMHSVSSPEETPAVLSTGGTLGSRRAWLPSCCLPSRNYEWHLAYR